jgi:FGGY-family pentulose kinase
MSEGCYLGIDVGTGSVRAGIFDRTGQRLGSATEEIRMWKPQEDFVEQSSEDIWAAAGRAVRAALGEAGLGPSAVRGIGFDATCSLVALDADDRPVTVSPSGADEQNVIVWMDHRALDQTARINDTGHPVLRYVGGGASPEMQTPKLMWLKENLPETWKRTTRFLDLPDFLTYRATGDDTRSLCTTVCKWGYLGHEEAADADDDGGGVGSWDPSFHDAAGLDDLHREGYARIGRRVRPMGEQLGNGLTPTAADELGLTPGTPVAVAIIDAHAGGLGMLGAPIDGRAPEAADFDHRLALIGGTSTCHMAVSEQARFIPGVWGPYYSAMVPGLWLTEGGQSATGALIDHVITSHARAAELHKKANNEGSTVYALLNRRLAEMAEGEPFPAALTSEVHVLPYFHGNRSPRANPSLRGAVHGLKLDDGIDALATYYLATIQAIALGTRHIIEALNDQGYSIDTLVACGGDTKNEVFVREHADATGCRIVLPAEPEAVLLGSALLGAVASGDFPSVIAGMGAMNHADQVIEPAGGEVARYHDAKYRVFHRMYEDQLAYGDLMENAGGSK